jgi:ABC-type branched-subunit amino acid transport system permease subunit
MRLRQTLTVLVAVGLLALLPAAIGEHYFVHLMANFFIFAILTMSLQLLIGFSGILSLGHAAFFGVGAYTAAVLSTRFGAPFPLALLGGCIIAGLLGLVMSPIIRLREVYFAIASFAFGIVVSELFVQWKSVTGGHDGLIMIPVATIGPLSLDTPSKFYYLALGFVALEYLLLSGLMGSVFGRALGAMRQNEQAARGVGLDLTSLKVVTIVVAAVSTGLAGGLYAHLYGSISPQTFDWSQSINLLTMVVIGGGAGLGGVLAATFLLLLLPEYFRAAAEYSTLINGAVLTLSLVVFPRGLGGIFDAFSAMLSKYRQSRPVIADAPSRAATPER